MSSRRLTRWVGGGLARRPGESWLGALIRVAIAGGLGWQALATYEAARDRGLSSREAATEAALHWGLVA